MAGCIAVVMIFRNHFDWAAYLIFLAAFFDLLDGMAARVLSLNSPFGKELDSLADMISFGFVPGLILFKLFQQSDFSSWALPLTVIQFIQFFPFIVTVFSALRLAKFNLDTRQSSSFIGLPTPANTLLIVSLPMILTLASPELSAFLLNPFFLLFLSVFLSYLLVSEIPLFALKFKNVSLKENLYQYILLIATLVLVPLLSWMAVPIIFVFYFLLSFFGKRSVGEV